MNIELNRIATDFKGETCFTHARAVIREDGFGLMTTQPLQLTGCDVFYGMYILTTLDGGKTWSAPRPSKTLLRQDMGDMQIVMCDATPMYHKKTGKILLLGHNAAYLNNKLAPAPRPRDTVYAVYDEEAGDFSPFKTLEMLESYPDEFFNAGNGSGQSIELDNGDILVPIYYMDKDMAAKGWKCCASAVVARCAFDGQDISVIEVGNSLFTDVPRGFDEPSIICHNGEYFMALRNDITGFVTKGSDGLHYQDATELVFDDGQNVGNYNTQQHWISGGGKLYMVYTRRGADNDHVFRHRAPLFIAEFDTERMCLIRDTERIAVPERGARLGNFGCQSNSDGKSGFVFASEWMQTLDPTPFDWSKCAAHGSDNSIFVSKITF